MSAPITQWYWVNLQSFEQKKEAEDYARTCSRMWGHSIFNVKYGGPVIASFYQGKRIKK